ncbi:hypothetical protein BS78_07G103700 [Paspalum vaginatum]|nr:hypothetical protein BS78_07G103700 [Paspalum vaginatum]
MEFMYRAGDERRSRSPPPPTAAPSAEPSASASGSADGHGPAERVGDSAAVAQDADELRRQAEKARIRERILREETEHWELEMEVRREIREQLLRLSWPVLWRTAMGSDPPVAPSSPAGIIATNSLPPVVTTLEAHPKANAPAVSPAKRKNPDHAAASTGSASTSSKKQKVALTCMLCGITANSEKTMQDHFNGKAHKRKAAVALPELPKLVPEPELETGHQAGEEEVMAMAPSGDYTPTKLMMLTNTGVLNEVMQMDGYLLCVVCNKRTADRVTMMCHLEGSKHLCKVQRKNQASRKPPDEVAGGVDATKKAVASADPETQVPEVYGVPHGVQRLEGFLLCELCDVKAPSMKGMQQHLSGKKHKSKVNASSDASANLSTGGKEAANKAQLADADTAAVADMAAQLETPLAKSFQATVGDDSELQKPTAASTKDVPTGDCTKTHADQVNNVCDSDSLTMEVDNVQHPLLRADGLLVCPCCNAKAQSEIIMRYHLAGKKHKHKMTLAARGNKREVSALGTGSVEVQGNSPKSTKANVEAESAQSVVPQAKNAAAMSAMEVDRPAEARPSTRIGPEEAESAASLAAPQLENAAAIADMVVAGPAEVQPTTYNESVKTNGAPGPAKPIKIQVEGKVFTVLQQENGRLSCGLCGVHGCDKDSMIRHLYTRTHWEETGLAEKKQQDGSVHGCG